MDKRPGIAFFASLFLGLFFAATLARAADTSDVSARLASDQSRIDALQRDLVRDQSRAGSTQVADLFGPSDEEKAAAAAAAQHEQAQDSNIATLNQRAGDIEDSIRRLTGQIEVLNHRLDEVDQHIERVRKEFQYKLCTLSAQQLGAAPGAPGAIPCNGDAMAPAVTMAPGPADDAPPTGVTHLAPPPGVLGTLPQNALSPPPEPQPAAQPSASPQDAMPLNQTASLDTHAQFDSAMNLLARSQYDEARGAFRTFADTYPKDPQAAQALYWVGDIAYVQKDYPSAARAFAEELKKYPTGLRAPESMLKLGQSLIAMNQKEQGCMALHALPGKYPTASKTVLAEADALRKSGGCKH